MLIPPASSPRQVLDFIDHFVQRLQHTSDAGRQMRAALDMVRGATEADLALVFASASGEVLAWAAESPPDLASNGALGRRLAAQVRGGDGLWFGALPGTGGSAAV